MDVIVELLAAGHFAARGLGPVRFVDEGDFPTPDFMCGENRVVEVKNFHTSDQEQEYFRSHQGEVRPGWNPYEFSVGNPFLVKIMKTLEEQVMPKFAAYGGGHYRRYLYANFSVDIVGLAAEDLSPNAKGAFYSGLSTLLGRHNVELFAIGRYSPERLLAGNA